MNELNVLFAAIVGVVTTTILGLLKTGDTKISAVLNKLGNLTPILVVGLNILLPHVWAMIGAPGAVPDATILLNTPISTAVSIGVRELYQVLFHKPLSTGVA